MARPSLEQMKRYLHILRGVMVVRWQRWNSSLMASTYLGLRLETIDYTSKKIPQQHTPFNKIGLLLVAALVVLNYDACALFPRLYRQNSCLGQLQNFAFLSASLVSSVFWSCILQSLSKISLFKTSSSFTARILSSSRPYVCSWSTF